MTENEKLTLCCQDPEKIKPISTYITMSPQAYLSGCREEIELLLTENSISYQFRACKKKEETVYHCYWVFLNPKLITGVVRKKVEDLIGSPSNLVRWGKLNELTAVWGGQVGGKE